MLNHKVIITCDDRYNALAEEVHDRSDTSSSSDEERDDDCVIM